MENLIGEVLTLLNALDEFLRAFKGDGLTTFADDAVCFEGFDQLGDGDRVGIEVASDFSIFEKRAEH